MAAPASYTEATLKNYMHAVIGAVSDEIDLSVAGGNYDEALNEALLTYGTGDISTITGSDNIRKLRAIARREVWRAVMQVTAHKHSVSVTHPGGSVRAESIHQHARKQFAMADEVLKEEYPTLAESPLDDIGYLDTDASGNDVYPIFQREAFGNRFKDWDPD